MDSFVTVTYPRTPGSAITPRSLGYAIRGLPYRIDVDSPGVIADTYQDFLTRLRDVARREPTRSAVQDNYLAC